MFLTTADKSNHMNTDLSFHVITMKVCSNCPNLVLGGADLMPCSIQQFIVFREIVWAFLCLTLHKTLARCVVTYCAALSLVRPGQVTGKDKIEGQSPA